MRQIVLGAVERQDFKKVREVANNLWWQPYWNSFHNLEHLEGWLLTNHHCAYCLTDLLESHIPARRAHTDHLLPRSRYPHLSTQSVMNAVASCDDCNLMKGDWDPNEEELIYHGGELLYQVRLELIERAKAYLKNKTRRPADQTTKMDSCRSAAEKASQDLA